MLLLLLFFHHTRRLLLHFHCFIVFVKDAIRSILLQEETLGIASSIPHCILERLMDIIQRILVLVTHFLEAQIFVKLHDELAGALCVEKCSVREDKLASLIDMI